MKAIVFDTETSGLVENRTRALDRQPEIVEFYACVVDLKTGKVAKELDFLAKPSVELTEDNMSKHGITNKMLEKAKPFKFYAPKVKEFFTFTKVAIAHNATFDRDMVEIEFERLKEKIKLPKLLCTIEQTMAIRGHRLNLSALHEYLFGKPFKGAHRAKVDVQALVRCCVELHKREMI